MNLQTLNATDAEKIFGNFTNAAGATITTGMAVALTVTLASMDGNKATLPAAALNNRIFLGVAASDVADNAVGLYQCYGYCGSIFYMAEATSVSVITANHAAGPGVADSLGVGYLGITYVLGPVIIMESLSGLVRSAGGYVRGFIRAM